MVKKKKWFKTKEYMKQYSFNRTPRRFFSVPKMCLFRSKIRFLSDMIQVQNTCKKLVEYKIF